MSDIIERYLSQRCVGYLRDGRGLITATLYECVVQYRGGRVATVRETHST